METDLQPDVSFDIFQKLDFRVAEVVSAKLTEGTRAPCRELVIDLGPLGERVSIGQFALIPEQELVGKKVIACCNLGTRRMGKYESQALVLGSPHPESPAGQAQALPLFAHPNAKSGNRIF